MPRTQPKLLGCSLGASAGAAMHRAGQAGLPAPPPALALPRPPSTPRPGLCCSSRALLPTCLPPPSSPFPVAAETAAVATGAAAAAAAGARLLTRSRCTSAAAAAPCLSAHAAPPHRTPPKRRGQQEEEKWVPVTKLGRLVQQVRGLRRGCQCCWARSGGARRHWFSAEACASIRWAVRVARRMPPSTHRASCQMAAHACRGPLPHALPTTPHHGARLPATLPRSPCCRPAALPCAPCWWVRVGRHTACVASWCRPTSGRHKLVPAHLRPTQAGAGPPQADTSWCRPTSGHHCAHGRAAAAARCHRGACELG